ncbi:hypothetical protein BJV78DRAFT_1197402, partial [Lactifluus subvellereus]
TVDTTAAREWHGACIYLRLWWAGMWSPGGSSRARTWTARGCSSNVWLTPVPARRMPIRAICVLFFIVLWRLVIR